MAIVVGTFENHRAVRALADSLKKSGQDVSKLQIVGDEEVPTELAAADAEYVYLGDVASGIIRAAGSTYVTGTDVPGLTDAAPRALGYPELGDYLSDLGIPDAKSDAYAKMVDGGKWLAGFPAGADAVDSLKSIFSAAGAQSVEVF